VKEIDLVSHDTTWYGRDRGVRDGLARLLQRLAGVPGLAWIRFLYGYPGEISPALLEAMAHPRICRYFDIPFQHADPGVLRRMGRGGDAGRALRLIERIRTRLPEAVLRTSLIVGFPGEGKRAFRALRRFVEEARFDHLGVFAYSSEAGTAAGRRPDTVSAEEKEERRREIMAVQSGISRARNLARRGRTVEVLVEGLDASSPGVWIGRGRFQAPEVDGIIRFSLPPGAAEPPSALVRVEINVAGDYDLGGSLVP
ncbi:MAG TPA: radical SAM protein, partial [Candidatus Aminicenantes bacterium]|nr:radical SAM protein [Candidatus Aminicenantes bacterium]